jgi:hypothetical protein
MQGIHSPFDIIHSLFDVLHVKDRPNVGVFFEMYRLLYEVSTATDCEQART